MGGGISFLFPLIIIGGMMFFMSRSQKKQQKQRQDLLNSMDVGSKVVTIGGLHGVISEINTEKSTVTLDCEGIFLEFNRIAISTVVPTAEAVTETVVTETIVEPAEIVEEVTEETTEDK